MHVFLKHMKTLKADFPSVILLSLLSRQSAQETGLVQMMELVMGQVEHQRISYVSYDFDVETQGQYSKLS